VEQLELVEMSIPLNIVEEFAQIKSKEASQLKCTTLFICIREWYDVEFSRVRKALDEASANLNELSGEDVQAAISVGDQRLPMRDMDPTGVKAKLASAQRIF